MTEAFASVNGLAARSLRVYVGNSGPWHAIADLESDAPLQAAATIRIGGLTLTGTIDPVYSGTFGAQRKCRVIAGGGGWGRDVDPRGYHNDAGVKARLVAEDAARAVGETIGTFVPAAERVGVDYARQRGPASRALEDACGPGVTWWVDYAGVTHAGPRTAASADAGGYDVVSYDPRARIATLAVDDPAAVGIGSIIAKDLDAGHAVRELELRCDGTELRAVVWLGGGDAYADRLVGLMRRIAQRATDGRLFGPWRYRVVRMTAGRAELQPVRAAAGLPDLAPIEVWPGVASAHADLTPGSHVLVQFIEGDRAQPIVTHVAPRGSTGWVPTSVTIGGDDGPPAARVGDAVDVFFPPGPGTFNGLMGVPPATVPITGTIVWTLTKAVGVITSGSTKVKIAT